ncbi:MAG: electron transfer flavoprotein subunit alpha/FixB family protein, partial [Acidilobaceae archaeon]
GDLKVNIVGVRAKELSGVKLEEAEVVVGVGRGFKSRDDLKLAFELAKILGAQVGGTRPIATDFKWLPEDAWIGISGKRIAPKLYIAVGVSGAPQHMSGVSSSKVIVAINKDKTAPIFKQADYGVVADLYKFLPILTSKLRERFPKRP